MSGTEVNETVKETLGESSPVEQTPIEFTRPQLNQIITPETHHVANDIKPCCCNFCNEASSTRSESPITVVNNDTNGKNDSDGKNESDGKIDCNSTPVTSTVGPN